MSLNVVHEALKADTERQVQALLDSATDEAESLLARSRTEAGALLDTARQEGRDIAERDTAHELARKQREVRATVLRADRALYDDVRRRAHAEALSLRDSPGYAHMLERLAVRAREQLGAGANLDIDPEGRGGVVGTSDDRRVDYTLPALVERCLALKAAEIERLWT